MRHSPVFSLSLRDMRRTQGAHNSFSLQGALDQPVETGLVHLAAGHPIRLTGELTSVGDGILVSAEVSATLDTECSRCLTTFSYPVRVDIQELFVYPERHTEYEDEDEQDDEYAGEGEEYFFGGEERPGAPDTEYE